MKALQPEIVLSELDVKRIERILSTLSPAELEKLMTLEDELERGNVVEPAAVPGNVVTMNSTVKFSVSSSQQTFCLTLVYPKDMTDDGKPSLFSLRRAAPCWVCWKAMKLSGRHRMAKP